MTYEMEYWRRDLGCLLECMATWEGWHWTAYTNMGRTDREVRRVVSFKACSLDTNHHGRISFLFPPKAVLPIPSVSVHVLLHFSRNVISVIIPILFPSVNIEKSL